MKFNYGFKVDDLWQAADSMASLAERRGQLREHAEPDQLFARSNPSQVQ